MFNLNSEPFQKFLAETQPMPGELYYASRLALESKQILTSAEAMLRGAALETDPPRIESTPAHAPTTVVDARADIMQAHQQVQRSYEGLKERMYTLLQAQVAAEEWNAASTTAKSIHAVDPAYRDVSMYATSVKMMEIESVLGPLIKIPAGEFLYGDDKKKETTNEFYIGKTPVTGAQFMKFVKASGYKWKSPLMFGSNPSKTPDYPMVNVNMKDVAAFCQWASNRLNIAVRLPTEQEWEKAARGTDGRKYPWGNEEPDHTRCNFDLAGYHVVAVGNYSPRGDSPYGCVDMSGNVWEWTNSLDGGAKSVVRGGAGNNNALGVQATYRYARGADERFPNCGFRVAANLQKGDQGSCP